MPNLLRSEWHTKAIALAEEAARRHPKVAVAMEADAEIRVEVDSVLSGVLSPYVNPADNGSMVLRFRSRSGTCPMGAIPALHDFACSMAAVIECAAWLEARTTSIVLWCKRAPCDFCGGRGKTGGGSECSKCGGAGQRREKENEAP